MRTSTFSRTMSKLVLVLIPGLLFIFMAMQSQAQVILQENFDATTNGSTACVAVCAAPTGWTNETTDDKDWSAISGSTGSIGTGPTSDHTSGSGKYMYTEASGCYNLTAILTSPSMNLTTYTGAALDFYYHMWATSSGMGDLYVDISADGGTTWTLAVWSISGDQGDQWHKATVSMLSYVGTGMNDVKIRFRGVTGSTYYSDISIDDVKVYQPIPMVFQSCTTVQGDTNDVPPGAADREIIAVEVVTVNLLNPLSATSFTFSTSGSTSASDITGATVYYTGISGTFSTAVPFGSPVANPNGTFTVTGNQALLEGTNYFWLAYDIANTATPSNVVDAECSSVTVAGTPYTPTVTAPAGSRTVNLVIAIGNGTLLNTAMPMECYYGYSYTQSIYKQSWIGVPAIITKIAYEYSGSTNTDAIVVYMAHSTADTFASATNANDWVPAAALTQVYSGNWTYSNGWVEIQLQTPFFYNGTDNLVIAFEENTSGYHGSSDDFYGTSIDGDLKSVYFYNDTYDPTPANPLPSTGSIGLIDVTPNTRLYYNTPTNLAYDTMMVSQASTLPVLPGQTDQEVIAVELVMDGALNPFDVTEFYFNTMGTSNPAINLSSAKLYYTGSSSVFATTNQFGTTLNNPSGAFMFTGTQTLSNGTNHFWLAYDLATNATVGAHVDAKCDSAKVNGIMRMPGDPAPIGYRQILAPLNGTYIVGPSANADFPDLTSVSTVLALVGVSGPVVFSLEPGTFYEQLTLVPAMGMSATNTVTFNGHGMADISYDAQSSSSMYTVALDGAHHYILDSLGIYGLNSTYAWGVLLINQADSNAITNCMIDISAASNTSSTYAYGAVVANASYTGSSAGNNANYITLSGNTIKGGYYGVRVYGSSSAYMAGWNISNNHISGYYYYGIYAYYTDAPIIENNVIDGWSSYSSNYGIYCYRGDNAFSISGNTVTGYGGYGIYPYYCNQTASVRGKVVNNMVSGSQYTSATYGLRLYYTNATDVFHNTIVSDPNTTSTAYGLYHYQSTQTAIVNNIFIAKNQGTGTTYALYTNNASNILDCDYNNYFANGNLAYWGGVKADLAALQSATGGPTGHNLNSKNIDVNFFSNNDLHTLDLNLNDLGTPLTAVTMDIDGDMRSTTAPDMGADEYTPPANDIAVTAWVEPLSGSGTNSAATVKIEVANFGTSAQSNIPFYYTVDGGNTWVGPQVYAGPLFSLGVDTITFTTTANLGNFAFYDAMGVAANPGDQNTANDTLAYSLLVCGSISGNYTVGGATADFANFTEVAAALGGCGITGGVTLNVIPGSGPFMEQVEFTAIAGASASTPIVINGNGETIAYGDQGSANRHILMLNGAKHITFNDLTFASTANSSYAWGAHLINGADSNTFNNCSFDLSASPNNSSNYSAFVVSSSATGFSSGNNANFGTLNGCDFIGGYYGVVIYGGSTSYEQDGWVVEDCNIMNYYYYGLYTYYTNNIQISNNVVESDPNGTTSGYGIYLYRANGPYLVEKNKITYPGTYAIYAYYGNQNAIGRARIVNNMIGGGFKYTSSVYGLYFYYSKNVDIHYNSFLVDPSSTGSTYGLYYGSTNNNTSILNNSFVVKNGGTGTSSYGFYSSSSYLSYIDACDYNNYWTNGSYTGYWGTYNSDLASFIGSSGGPSGHDANSVSVDVAYNSMTDLHTQDFFFQDKGTPIPGITKDIDGQGRSNTTPDIGADEFTLYPNDAGILSIDQPLDNQCPGNYAVKVVVKNFGTTNLTSVIVHWSVNGVNQAPLIWSGNVTPGNTTALLTLGTAYFHGGSNYVKANTILPNSVLDDKTTNDQMTRYVMMGNVPSVMLGAINGGTVCSDQSPFLLTQGSPAGGTYSGAGVNNGIFYPASAGLGTHTITYTYMNTFGCSASASTTVQVNQGPQVFVIPIPGACNSAGVVQLTQGYPNGGTYSGTGVNSTTGAFNPLSAGIGTHTIYYDYTDQLTGCSNSASGSITVNPLPTVTFPTPADVCVNAAPSMLMTATPFGGTYSGTGVSNNLFNPAVAGVGGHALTYTYTSPMTGCTNVKTSTIHVNPLPTITFPPVADQCINGAPLLLNTATPAGGTYAGTGVTNNSFNPATAGVGTYTISYTKTLSTSGCSNTGTQTITVLPLPTVTFGALGHTCIDNTTFTLSTGYPLGGTYSGAGVSGTNFNATAAGLGSHTLTYSYTNAAGCTKSTNSLIFVHALPNPSFTGLAYKYCEDDTAGILVGNPTGGTFSGSGVLGNQFYPGFAHAGTHSIGYTYTDTWGCTNIKYKTTTVYSDPIVFIGEDTTICRSHVISLEADTGMDAYRWSTGWTGRVLTLDSTDLNYGFNTIIVTVWKNGCDNFDTINVIVDPCTGIDDLASDDFLQIYPNPNSGQFNMVVLGEEGDMNLAVFNELGQVLITDKFHLSANTAYQRAFDMSTYPTGVYFVKVYGQNAVKVKKVIVQ